MATLFTPRRVEMSDGSTLYEIVTPEGERIATCTNAAAAASLATSLNSNCGSWRQHVGFDAELNEVPQ